MLYFLGVNFRSCDILALGRVQMGDGLEGGEAAEGREEKGTGRTEVVIGMSNDEGSRGFNAYTDSRQIIHEQEC